MNRLFLTLFLVYILINQCPGGRIDRRGYDEYQFQPQANYYPRRDREEKRYNQEAANYEEPHYGSHREQLREEKEESFDPGSYELEEEEQPNQDGVWRAYKKKGGGMRVISMGGGKKKKKG